MSVTSAIPRFLPLLLKSPLFTSHFLADEERQALVDAMLPAKTLTRGCDLMREGDTADALFVVIDGWAARYTTTEGGDRQFPTLLIPGDVANLDSLMFDRLDYGVRTLSATTTVALPRERARALAATHPGIARTFTWLAMVENTTLSKWVLSLGRRSSRSRLAHLLCELSVRLGENEAERASFSFPLTQEHLADALGLTAVHVNRTMQHLRSDGLIATKDKTMTLLNVAQLKAICGFDGRYLHCDPCAGHEPI